jgi:hypothetical protein
MFHLGVVDHVRLSLTREGENYAIHARAAEQLARRASSVRIGVLVLMLTAAAASAVGIAEAGIAFRIAAVVAGSIAFAAHSVYIACGLETRVNAHRACANSLWIICERYRALLSEIHDGLLDRGGILRRRDALAAETQAAYAQAFPLDQAAFETARQSPDTKGMQVESMAEEEFAVTT